MVILINSRAIIMLWQLHGTCMFISCQNWAHLKKKLWPVHNLLTKMCFVQFYTTFKIAVTNFLSLWTEFNEKCAITNTFTGHCVILKSGQSIDTFRFFAISQKINHIKCEINGWIQQFNETLEQSAALSGLGFHTAAAKWQSVWIGIYLLANTDVSNVSNTF